MDLAISELSRCAGVKVPTIRYYEGAGLMAAPVRTVGNQRRYTAHHVSRLNFIRHVRELGFAAGAIREFLALAVQPERSCTEVDGIARRHVRDIDRRIAQLEALRRELQRSLDACGRGRVDECRVIEALAEDHPASVVRRGERAPGPASARRLARGGAPVA